jgi:hypothetical protein
MTFFFGFISSLAAMLFGAVVVRWAWPNFKDKCLYSGIRVDGAWDITEERNGETMTVGRIELRQTGLRVEGNSCRTRTRYGKESDRKFSYAGTIHGNQVTLVFEDERGKGFDTGTYVFIVQNDAKTMVGMATFHGKHENRIVSESRILKKVAT